MNIRLGDLRQLIHEEFLHGVPEFMIRQATNDCTNRIRQHIKKFVQQRAENQTHARELMQTANETLSELDDQLFKVIEDKLWLFVQKT